MRLHKVKMFILFVLITIVFSCDEDDDGQIKFEGIVLTDAQGTPMGTYGSRDLDDWGADKRLPEKVMKLLDFDPGTDLSDTDYSIVQISPAYPNPCSYATTIKIDLLGGGPTKVNLILVHEDLRVRFRHSYIGYGSEHTFDLSNENIFPNNSIMRLYYGFSKEGDKFFYVGHGDILVCHTGDCI